MKEYIRRSLTAMVLGGAAVLLWSYMPVWLVSLALGVILAYVLFVEWPQFDAWPITAVYPVLPCIALIFINQMRLVPVLPFLCLVTFGHDTGAYIAGKLLGRHKILPSVSPGKSWEGFVGGYVFSLAVAAFFVYYAHIDIAFLWLVPYVFYLNAAALSGDLFESFLKRRVGVKDSGTLLPGHGGVLDRIDGLLFVAIAYFIVRLL